MLFPSEELVGIVNYGSMDPVNDILPDVRQDILWDDDSFSPLATFITWMGGAEKCHDDHFRWPEEIMDKFAVTSGAVGTTAAGIETANIVFNSANMKVGDYIFNPGSGQYYFVSTWTSATTTTSTVKLTAAPISAGGTAISGTVSWRVLGNHPLEKGYLPVGIGGHPTWYTNTIETQVQVAEISWEMDDIALWYNENQHQHDIKLAYRAIFSGFERSFLFNKGGKEVRTLVNERGEISTGYARDTTGMMQWVTQVGSYSGDLDRATFNSLMYQKVFGPRNSGDRTKVMSTGVNVWQAIEDMGLQQIRYKSEDNELGMQINSVKTYGNREVMLLEEREFSNDVNADEYADTALIFDPNLLKIKHLSDQYIKMASYNPGRQMIRGIFFWGTGGLEIRGRGKHTILTKIA